MGTFVTSTARRWRKRLNFDRIRRNGRVKIDIAIRPTALGKKSWLFMGDADAGEWGAILYTVIESCRRRGINPYTYLKDVLTRLPP